MTRFNKSHNERKVSNRRPTERPQAPRSSGSGSARTESDSAPRQAEQAAPPARGSREIDEPLGLVLAPIEARENFRRLDLASLLLTALSDSELDPVSGILRSVSADVEALAMATHDSREDLGAAFNSFMHFIAARVRVAEELHRRMLAEAQKTTRAGGEEGSSR